MLEPYDLQLVFFLLFAKQRFLLSLFSVNLEGMYMLLS